MYKHEITKLIENFAPLETQEEWDCSGFAVDVCAYDDIKKVMLCLTVTNDVVNQARMQNCDMIISHHPCFYVPLDWSDINIYSAHTNLDKAQGGTTDTIIEKLGLQDYKLPLEHEFLRLIEYETTISDFGNLLLNISPNARVVNNFGTKVLRKTAFCAGSGSEFIHEAQSLGADCLVSGDLKFHTALESPIVIFDIGHFESEVIVLPVFERLLNNCVEVVYAHEQSPFRQIND